MLERQTTYGRGFGLKAAGRPRKVPFGAGPIEALCPQCGLCCNGVLFADVELRKSDRTSALEKLGLAVFKRGRHRVFAQPCGCFDGRHCAIYEDRPTHCQAFECGLLQRVSAGKLTAAEALKTIAQAKRKVARVESLLKKLGETDASPALTQRYVAAMSAPVDLASNRGPDHQGQLMRQMGELMELLEVKFRT